MTRWTEHGDALKEQIEAIHAESFGWALACAAGDRDLAEEALQHAYLKVLEGRARFAGRSRFKTWLFGVIRLSVLEKRRRRAWRRFSPLELLGEKEERPVTAALDQALVVAEQQQTLRRALSHLGEKQRQVLHLVFYQDLTIEQAAEVLDMRLGTARTHYQRGKTRLRRLLEEVA